MILSEPTNTVVIIIYTLLVTFAGDLRWLTLFWRFCNPSRMHYDVVIIIEQFYSFGKSSCNVHGPQEERDEKRQVILHLGVFFIFFPTFYMIKSYCNFRNIFIFNLALSDFLLVIIHNLILSIEVIFSAGEFNTIHGFRWSHQILVTSLLLDWLQVIDNKN